MAVPQGSAPLWLHEHVAACRSRRRSSRIRMQHRSSSLKACNSGLPAGAAGGAAEQAELGYSRRIQGSCGSNSVLRPLQLQQDIG